MMLSNKKSPGSQQITTKDLEDITSMMAVMLQLTQIVTKPLCRRAGTEKLYWKSRTKTNYWLGKGHVLDRSRWMNG